MNHFVSGSCKGELCGLCLRHKSRREPATHKVAEEIPHDDPNQNRHELTNYVCCECFVLIMGYAAARSCFAAPAQ